MNKKRIGALLIGATLLVGAIGSFAYFNVKNSAIGGNSGQGLKVLKITNGKIEVSSKVTNQGENKLDWSYDVAKLSTDIDKDTPEINYSWGGNDITESIDSFENKHRSPDINANEKSVVGSSKIERAEIGSALPDTIYFTRPGDAIVLGVKNSKGETGLVVTNNSNLTVKMQLVVKTDEKAQAMIKAMKDAGWVMYVNGEVATFESGNVVNLGVIAPGSDSGEIVDVRFELPLLTENEKQNETNVIGSIEALDLSQIIEIQATQENNGGWNEDGTGDRINAKTTVTE